MPKKSVCWIIVLSMVAVGIVLGAGKISAQQKADPVKLLFLGYGEGSAGTIMTAKVGELMLKELPAGSNIKTTTGSSIGSIPREISSRVLRSAT